MALLSFDEIRAKVATEVKTEDVEVPSLGGSVRISRLGAEQKIALGLQYQSYPRTADGKRLANSADIAEFNMLLLAASIVDESGGHPFANAYGREVLNGIDPSDLMMLANCAVTLNGMDKDPLEDAKKNLSEAPSGNSPSPSVESLADHSSTPTICSPV